MSEISMKFLRRHRELRTMLYTIALGELKRFLF